MDCVRYILLHLLSCHLLILLYDTAGRSARYVTKFCLGPASNRPEAPPFISHLRGRSLLADEDKKDWHGLTEKAVNQLTILCGSNAEYKRRMDYAVELAKTRKVKNVPAFLYKAVRENYLKQDQDMKAAVEREFKAKQENAAWELDAIKMFGDKIALDVEETPFDQSDDMGRAMVDVVKKALEERHLNVTAKRLLEDHGMSVARFIELYCQEK